MLMRSGIDAPALQAETQPPAAPWESISARHAPLAGQIRDIRGAAELTAEALIQRLASADFVLLGEVHDNPDHHRLQAWITARLLESGHAFAVAFEMIDSSKAESLAGHLAASPGDSHGLGAALGWGKSGWPDWRHYQPIADAVLTKGLPIIAANLSPDLARAVAREGLAALPPAMAPALGLDIAGDAGLLIDHGAEIQRAHCGMLPPDRLGNFALAQYARDAEMARAMAEPWRQTDGKRGVILIAGAGHVRNDRGVPRHLARLAPGARVISLAFVESPDEGFSQQALAGLPYDIAWFTARSKSVDHCATLQMPR